MNDSALPSGVAYTRDNAVDVVAPPAPPPPAPPPSTSPPPPPPPPPVAPFDAPSATVDLGTPRGEPCVDGEDHLPSGIRMIIIGLLVGFFLDVFGLFFICCRCCCPWVPKMQDTRYLRNKFMLGWALGYVALFLLNNLLHYYADWSSTWWVELTSLAIS